jgi:hypothetical protein
MSTTFQWNEGGGAHRAIRDGATAGRPMHLPQKD